MLQLLAIGAVALSGLFYIILGLRTFTGARDLSDHIPIAGEGGAVVRTSVEFSSATVATTVSLTTLILAYFELAGFFGPWLFWTAITTGLGLFAVRAFAPLIWRRLNAIDGAKPTLHGFLGFVFSSPALAFTAALCTTFGFLGALAVELTVGSRFLATLIGANPQLVVVLLSAVAVLYTLLGGFRVVIETDQWQMRAIWASIAMLAGLVVWHISTTGGFAHFAATAPEPVYALTWRDGLGPFLIGIFIINVPTFLADMSVWQRIAGTRDEEVLKSGLWRSIGGAVLSWTALVILACAITAISPATDGGNTLAQFLRSVTPAGGALAAVAVFITIIGLYAASLSTASTQLIASAQTAQVDLLEQRRATVDPAARRRLIISRLLILILGVGSVFIVEGLRAAGFSITDLVFALFGCQLGMVPAVLLALIGKPERNKLRGGLVAVGVAAGFVCGWGAAIYGKMVGDANLVFLAPLASLAAGTIFSLLASALGKRA